MQNCLGDRIDFHPASPIHPSPSINHALPALITSDEATNAPSMHALRATCVKGNVATLKNQRFGYATPTLAVRTANGG